MPLCQYTQLKTCSDNKSLTRPWKSGLHRHFKDIHQSTLEIATLPLVITLFRTVRYRSTKSLTLTIFYPMLWEKSSFTQKIMKSNTMKHVKTQMEQSKQANAKLLTMLIIFQQTL